MTWSKRTGRSRHRWHLWLFGAVWTAWASALAGPVDPEMAAIERLHAQDVAATLSGDPKALAQLWTEDAVRLEEGNEAEVGLPVIRARDEKDKRERPDMKIITYAPDIKDVRIAGDWAFEWGYFSGSYQTSAGEPPKNYRAKLLRVLHRQSDGSWKFARVMWNLIR